MAQFEGRQLFDEKSIENVKQCSFVGVSIFFIENRDALNLRKLRLILSTHIFKIRIISLWIVPRTTHHPVDAKCSS